MARRMPRGGVKLRGGRRTISRARWKRREAFLRQCEQAAERGYDVVVNAAPDGRRSARLYVARDAAILLMGIHDPDEPYQAAANRWGPKALPAGGFYGDTGLSRAALAALRRTITEYSSALMWTVQQFRDRRSKLRHVERVTQFRRILAAFDCGVFALEATIRAAQSSSNVAQP